MTVIRVTPEFFDELLRRLDEPPREPNEKMGDLLRKTRGTIRHRYYDLDDVIAEFCPDGLGDDEAER